LISLLLLAVALGTDSFSLCLGLSMTRIRAWRAGVFVLLVTVLHVLLPLAGWHLGRGLSLILERYSDYAAAAVLLYLAYKLVQQGLQARGEAALPAGFAALFLLAASVSVDSLSAGLVLSNQSYRPLQAAPLIGVTAGVMTLLGFATGRRLGLWAGTRAQVLGGLVLFLLAVKIVLRI